MVCELFKFIAMDPFSHPIPAILLSSIFDFFRNYTNNTFETWSALENTY